MNHLFQIPTYHPDTGPVEPLVPVFVSAVKPEDGIRVVLGATPDTAETTDSKKPDLFIERRRNGWCIFLTPVGGGDPSGYVYFLDDGQSFVVPDGLQVLNHLPKEADVAPHKGAPQA